MFPRTSRYYNIEIAKLVTPDEREIAYLRRRFVPSADGAVIIAEHPVEEGDRLDNVTANFLGDPEQFWQVCDVNDALRPDELTEEIGRRLKIAMPRGGQ
jgi:hypothetical protein